MLVQAFDGAALLWGGDEFLACRGRESRAATAACSEGVIAGLVPASAALTPNVLLMMVTVVATVAVSALPQLGFVPVRAHSNCSGVYCGDPFVVQAGFLPAFGLRSDLMRGILATWLWLWKPSQSW